MVIYNHSWQSESVSFEVLGNLFGNYGQKWVNSLEFQVFLGCHECIRVEFQLVACLIFWVNLRYILYVPLKHAVNFLHT